MTNYNDIRQQVIDASLRAQKRGLINGTSGNISIRSADGKVVAISPTSIPYEDLTPELIPLVNLDGEIVDGNTKPSSELPMHLSVLRARPDVNAVVHTHSKFSTLLGNIGQPLPVCTIPLIVYTPPEEISDWGSAENAMAAPIVPFEFPGSPELGEAVVKTLGKHGSAVILEMHGLLTVGKDIDKAMMCTEYVEEGAEIAYFNRLATGEVRAIPQDKLDVMIEILKSGRAL